MKIGSETTWDEIAAGTYHSCGTQHRLPFGNVVSGEVSSLWCWGVADNGRLGIGASNLSDRHSPANVTINGEADWGGESAVTVGEEHTCAINKPSSNGSLWCWGSDQRQQLGDGGTINTAGVDRYSPIRIYGSSGISLTTSWLAVSSEIGHTCAFDSNRYISCWGSGSGGKLGNGDEVDRSRPARVGPPRTAAVSYVEISAGWGHTCAIKRDEVPNQPPGPLACWGSNSSGQLGDSTTTKRLVPTTVIG